MGIEGNSWDPIKQSDAISPANASGTSATSGTRSRVDDRFTMPFEPGQILAGKYEIIELIGEGGVGFVVAANHIELGDKVALKFLRPEMLARPEIVGRFSREAMAAVKIKSEHVARVFDVGSLHDGTPFIVMEFLEGRDLYDVITQDGPQSIKCAIDYILQACEALADAHVCGIVHRDIKPENLFLIQRSHGIDLIKVLDFGISKVALTGSVVETRVPLIRTMLPMGSPVYMSPEQIRATNPVDSRTDIWSIGCVLHELLTGNPVFDAPSLTQLTAKILETDPVPPSQGRAHIPAELDAVVARCLEKDPDLRFQNVAELALALYPFASNRSQVSVERCCLLLDLASISDTDFEMKPGRTSTDPGLDRDRLSADRQLSITSVSQVGDETLISIHSARKSRRNALLVGLAFVVVAAVLFWLRTLYQPRVDTRTNTPAAPLASASGVHLVPPPVKTPVAAPTRLTTQAAASEPAPTAEAAEAAPSATLKTSANEQVIAVEKLPILPKNISPRKPAANANKSTNQGNTGAVVNDNSDPDPGF